MDMLHADFWLARIPDADTPLLTPEDITAFNAHVPKKLALPAIFDLPETLSPDRVRAEIGQYQPPGSARYGGNGQILPPVYWDALLENAQPQLSGPVRYGLMTQRADVRAFPTPDVVTSRPYEFALDRLQETTVDVGWPVAAVADSQDGKWSFCLTPLYWGWVRHELIAWGAKPAVEAYCTAPEFVITVARRALVAWAAGGGITTQMGTRLPLLDQTTSAFQVKLPARKTGGALTFKDGWIASHTEEVQAGYLPCTLRTVFGAAFKLLGEYYAWGGSRFGIFGRDCSRLIRDIFAVTGVLLPRNGNQQGQVCRELLNFPPEMSEAARKSALIEQVSPGAILVLPGHVMLYLGDLDGEPYVLHDTFSGEHMSVIVSDLSLMSDVTTGSLLKRLTQAVRIGLV